MTTKPESKLETFLQKANDKQIASLAKYAKTSEAYLRHLARGYGGRTPNVRLALLIEEFTTKLNAKHPDLPVVTCEDLAEQ